MKIILIKNCKECPYESQGFCRTNNVYIPLEIYGKNEKFLEWCPLEEEKDFISEVCNSCGLKRSVDEALNTGDGAYRP